MKNKKLFWTFLILALFSFLALLLVYQRLPQTIPTNFDFQGNINGYGSRSTILVIGILPAVLWILFWFLPTIDPKYQNYSKNRNVYFLMGILLTLFLILVTWIMYFKAVGISIPIERVIPGCIGILLLVIGNFLPRVRPNYFFGIRTPWTMSSEYVWKKTHKLGGILFCIMGGVLILLPLFPLTNNLGTILTLVLIIGCCFVLYLYSYRIYKKSSQNS